MDYHFELVQKLNFGVYDIDNKTIDLSDDDFLGELECTLGQVLVFLLRFYHPGHSSGWSRFTIKHRPLAGTVQVQTNDFIVQSFIHYIHCLQRFTTKRDRIENITYIFFII